MVDTNSEPDATPSRGGRPAVKPGEDSIEVRATIELSLHRQLRQIAQTTRNEHGLPGVIREALREFSAKKLRDARP